jgi:hypothetical protein
MNLQADRRRLPILVARVPRHLLAVEPHGERVALRLEADAVPIVGLE